MEIVNGIEQLEGTGGLAGSASDAEFVAQTRDDVAVTPSNMAVAHPVNVNSFKASINTETLAATKTLVVGDLVIQWLNPDGVERIVALPAEASSTNLMFIILNTGIVATFDLVVKNDAAATIATLGPEMGGIFSCDGTNWKWEDETGVYYDGISGLLKPRDDIAQMVLPQANTPTAPTLAFGDGNSGFYESGDDQIIIALAGVPRYSLNSTRIIAANGRGALSTLFASDTAPNLYPNGEDSNTGMGRAGDDQLSLIAGGVEGIRITEVAGNIENKLMGVVATPTTQTLTGAGAVDIVSAMTLIVTTGADALTLANGAVGQDKYLVMTTDGGAGTLTPTNLLNGTTITFDDVGDSAHLKFMSTGWVWMGGTATLA